MHSTLDETFIATSCPSTPGLDFVPTPMTIKEEPLTPLILETPCKSRNREKKPELETIELVAVEDSSPAPTAKELIRGERLAEDGWLFKSGYGDVVQSTVSIKEVTTNTADNTERIVKFSSKKIEFNFSKVQIDDMYRQVSQTVIAEITKGIGSKVDIDFDSVESSETTTRVAQIIERFVLENRVRLTSYQSVVEATTAKLNGKGYTSKYLRGLNRTRETIATTLSWSNDKRYCTILPTDLIKRLTDHSKRCVSNKQARKSKKDEEVGKTMTEQEEKCRRYAKLDASEAIGLLGQLARKASEPCQFGEIAKLVGDIIEKACCTQDHQWRAKYRLKKLRYHLYQPVKAEDMAKRAEEVRALQKWLNKLTSSIADNVNETSSKTVQNERTKSRKSGKFRRDIEDVYQAVPCSASTEKLAKQLIAPSAASFWEQISFIKEDDFKAEDLSPSGHLNHEHSIPYSSLRSSTIKDTPVMEAILKEVKNPLTKTDRDEAGYIYVFWHEGNFGFVKIGRAANIPDRLAQWRAQCGYDLLEHNDKLNFPRQVRHPARVEKLIHIDLEKRRLIEPECEGCRKSHYEWFKIGSHEAQRVVAKWTRWMQREDPYDEEGNFVTSTALPEIFEDEEVSKTNCTESCKKASGRTVGRNTRASHHYAREHNPDSQNAILAGGL